MESTDSSSLSRELLAEAESHMAAIDYRALRSQISIKQVLDLIEFNPTETDGEQIRGPCPVHRSVSSKGRSFSANLKKNAYRCFKCGSQGNQLDLWASATGQELYEATRDLCKRLGLNPPVLHEPAGERD